MSSEVSDLPHLARAYVRHCEAAGLSVHTILHYKVALRPFLRWCYVRGIHARAISVDAIDDYLASRRSVGRKPATIRAEAVAIHTYLTWLASPPRRAVALDVVASMRLPKAPRTVIRPFSPDQVRALINAAGQRKSGPRDQAMLLVLADTGCRAEELCKLRDEDIRGSRVLIHGKGSRERELPLSEDALSALRRWRMVRPDGAERLFVNSRGTAFTPHLLRYHFRVLGQMAKLAGVRTSPHTMRHSVGANWVRTGGDILSLKKLLGHARIETTERYADLDDEALRQAHSRHGLVERLSRERRQG